MRKKVFIVITIICLMLCFALLQVSCSFFKDKTEKVTTPTVTFEGNDVTAYIQGDTFSVNGLVLVFDDGKGSKIRIAVTEDMIAQMPDMSTPGTKTVEVLYYGKTYSFQIEVTAASSGPGGETPAAGHLEGCKTAYFQNETLSLDGASLVIGSTIIPLNRSMIAQMPDMSEIGEQTVVFRYNGKEYPLVINISAIEEISYAFRGLGEAKQGETFDYSGFTLVISYNNQTTTTLRERDVNILNVPDLETPGDKVFTVSYNGKNYSYTFNVARDAVYEMQKLVDAYRSGLAIYENNHDVKVAARLSGSMRGFGTEVALDETLMDAPLWEEQEAFVDYFQKVFVQTLIRESMAGRIEDLSGTPGAVLDVSGFEENLSAELSAAVLNWGVWSELFFDMLAEKGTIDEAEATAWKALKEKIEQIINMPVTEKATTSVYQYISLFSDISVERLEEYTESAKLFVKELLEEYYFEDLSEVFEHVFDEITPRLSSFGLIELIYDDLAMDIVNATVADLQVLRERYLSNDIPSLAKVLEAKRDLCPLNGADYEALLNIFTAIDILIADEVSEEQVLLIADELEAFTQRRFADIRIYAQDYVLENVRIYAIELLPEALYTPIEEAINLIEEAYADKTLSEIDYVAVRNGIIEKGEALLRVIIDGYDGGEFTLIKDTLKREEDFWRIILSAEDFAECLNIAEQIDALVVTGYDQEKLEALLNALWNIKKEHVDALPEYWIVNYALMGLELATDYLPTEEGAVIVATKELFENTFKDKNLVNVDYYCFASEFLSIWEDEIARFVEKYDEGTFALLENLFHENKDLLADVLSEDDITACEIIVQKIDEMIVNGYDEETLKSLLDALWGIKSDYLDTMPEYWIILYASTGLDLVKEYLPEKEGEVFDDTETLLKSYFEDKNWVNVAYLTFSSELRSLWENEISRYVEEYEDGTLAVLNDFFERYTDCLDDFLSEKELEAFADIAQSLDRIIVYNYSERMLSDIMESLWKIKGERIGNDYENEAYNAIMTFLSWAEEYLPAQEGKIFTDTAALLEEFFEDADYYHVDYRQFADRFLELWTEEGERYADLYAFGELSLLTDFFDRYESMLCENADLSAGHAEAIRAFLQEVDCMISDGFDKEALRVQVFSLIRAFSDKLDLSDEERQMVDLLSIWTDNEAEESKEIRTLRLLKDDIAGMIAEEIAVSLELSSADAQELSDILGGFLTSYCDGATSYLSNLEELLDFCAKAASDEERTEFIMIGLVIAIYGDKVLGYDINYNRLMQVLPLPDAVESIDYNVLFNRALMDLSAEDIFFIGTPVIEYVLAEDGSLEQEIVSFDIRIAFEALPIAMDTTLHLCVEIRL